MATPYNDHSFLKESPTIALDLGIQLFFHIRDLPTSFQQIM